MKSFKKNRSQVLHEYGIAMFLLIVIGMIVVLLLLQVDPGVALSLVAGAISLLIGLFVLLVLFAILETLEEIRDGGRATEAETEVSAKTETKGTEPAQKPAAVYVIDAPDD